MDETKHTKSALTWKQAFLKSPGPRRVSEYFYLASKGFGMGTADLIPGVSGGTIAFITGIYEQLLEAVSSLDRKSLSLLLSFKLKDFASRVHLRFIFTLALGLVSAIFLLARLMHFLLTHYPLPTWGLFFGLISASIIIIWKELKAPLSFKPFLSILIGTISSFYIVGLIPVETPNDWWFIYLCGVIGITAMILPGLSGSFLLLILGKYEFITAALKNPFVSSNLLILSIFLCGTFTGLLGFSKILNWLMKNYRNVTMALLTGVLIGSLRKVWPWKETLETVMIRGKERVLSEANRLPTNLNAEDVATISLMLFGFLIVLTMEHFRSH